MKKIDLKAIRVRLELPLERCELHPQSPGYPHGYTISASTEEEGRINICFGDSAYHVPIEAGIEAVEKARDEADLFRRLEKICL